VRFNRAIDWLTLVVGPADDARILALDHCGDVFDPYPKPAPKWRGFRSGEYREWLGGLVRRFTAPAQASNEHGSEYSAWVFSSAQAQMVAPLVRAHGRPTRVDVAFDFQVPAEWGAVEFAEASVQLRRPCYRSVTMAGCELARTVYVGGRDSPRMIRVYRKDLERGPKWMHGPVLRIEAELKGEAAKDFWMAHAYGDDRAFAMAAGVVQQLLGVEVQDERDFWPLSTPPVASDVVAKVAHFMRQYASVVCALEAAGVRVGHLAGDCLRARRRGPARSGFDERLLLKAVRDLGQGLFQRSVVRECAAEVRRA